jgi:thymidylate synthase (FAD)
MKVNLKSITPEAEVNIVEIARVSSPRQDKKEKPEGLINYLIKNNHWSPLEHSYMTIEIETSKAIGIQLLRHRSFTFQEFSQRYAKVDKMEDVEIRKQAEKNRQSSDEVFDPIVRRVEPQYFDRSYIEGKTFFASERIEFIKEMCQMVYSELLDAGVAKECARMILPMCTSTTIYMTGSIRSWVHFLSIRDDEHAQKEIQLIAKEIKQIFCKELPIISKALGYVTSKEI